MYVLWRQSTQDPPGKVLWNAAAAGRIVQNKYRLVAFSPGGEIMTFADFGCDHTAAAAFARIRSALAGGQRFLDLTEGGDE